MTLSELGTTLRMEREQRGLSLDDVAQRLRISLHVLQSLEEGDVNALPHKAYAKGFIRSYATLLGLATDEVEACVASLSGAAPSVPQPICSMDDEEAPRVPAGKMLAVAAVLLLLAGGGYAVWHFNLLTLVSTSLEQFRTAQPLLPESVKQDGTAPDVAKPETAKPKAPAQTVAQAPTRAEQKAQPQAETKPVSKQEKRPEAGPESRPDTRKDPKPSPVASTPVTHHKIIVMATEDCWIQSNADQSNARQFSLRKGDTFALTFAKSLEVKLGNAAAVRIRYNGNELPQAGKPGEARTLVFPLAENQ